MTDLKQKNKEAYERFKSSPQYKKMLEDRKIKRRLANPQKEANRFSKVFNKTVKQDQWSKECLEFGGRTRKEICTKKYLKSEKGKLASKISKKKYKQSEKGKTIMNKAMKKYQESEKGKEARKRYQSTPEFKVKRKEYMKKYLENETNRQKHRESTAKAFQKHFKTDKYKETRKKYYDKNPEVLARNLLYLQTRSGKKRINNYHLNDTLNGFKGTKQTNLDRELIQLLEI